MLPAIGFGALVVATPPLVFSGWLPQMQAYLAPFCASMFAVVVRAARRGREGAMTFVVASEVLAATVFHDIMVTLRVVQTPVFMLPVGIATFMFMQALALLRRFSFALIRLEAASDDLARASDPGRPAASRCRVFCE